MERISGLRVRSTIPTQSYSKLLVLGISVTVRAIDRESVEFSAKALDPLSRLSPRRGFLKPSTTCCPTADIHSPVFPNVSCRFPAR
jgi:hypothetical protein